MVLPDLGGAVGPTFVVSDPWTWSPCIFMLSVEAFGRVWG
jgi:hypothetical protein